MDEDLPAFVPTLSHPANMKIGEIIASNLVEDGATIQIGVGELPQCILPFLIHHKNLGVHTEVFSDGVMDLYERGVITNAKKVHKPGHIVSCACGARARARARGLLDGCSVVDPGRSVYQGVTNAVRLVPRQPVREPVRHFLHEQQRASSAFATAVLVTWSLIAHCSVCVCGRRCAEVHF